MVIESLMVNYAKIFSVHMISYVANLHKSCNTYRPQQCKKKNGENNKKWDDIYLVQSQCVVHRFYYLVYDMS